MAFSGAATLTIFVGNAVPGVPGIALDAATNAVLRNARDGVPYRSMRFSSNRVQMVSPFHRRSGCRFPTRSAPASARSFLARRNADGHSSPAAARLRNAPHLRAILFVAVRLAFRRLVQHVFQSLMNELKRRTTMAVRVERFDVGALVPLAETSDELVRGELLFHLSYGL